MVTPRTQRVQRLTALGAGLLAGLCCVFVLSVASARPKTAECKASGPPGRIDEQPAFESLSTLQYDGKSWVVLLDQPSDPKHIRLISSGGVALELARPPKFTPSQWFGRGTAVYGLGTARSLEEGKVNIVLVRWAMDGRRPRVIRLWTQDAVASAPVAVLNDASLAVAWAAGGGERAAWTVGLTDLERVDVAEAVQVGKPAAQVSGHIMADGKGFRTLWVANGKVRTAKLDDRGGVVKAGAVAWDGKPDPLSTVQCGENLFALDAGTDGHARLLLIADGSAKPVGTFDSVDLAEMPLTCADSAALVGHRTWNDKAGSVVFWIATVDAAGNTSARRLRDIKGEKDDIRLPTLVGADGDISAWWAQKNGARTELYTRPIACR